MRAGFLKIKPECKAGMADLPVCEANISVYKISFPQEVIYNLVCYTAVFSVVTQLTSSSSSWGGALRDDTKKRLCSRLEV